MRIVTPADLILLKLYAGGPQDLWTSRSSSRLCRARERCGRKSKSGSLERRRRAGPDGASSSEAAPQTLEALPR